MTNPEIISAIRARGYPDDLLDSQITEGINGSLRDIKFDYPIEVYGSFTTVENQQVYDLFSATVNVPTQQGALPGGLRVLELIGGPFTGDASLDVFGLAPWLQASYDPTGITGTNRTSFSTPGDFTLWDANWSAWARRFGTYQFFPVSSLPGAAIRIIPKPTSATSVLVHYTKYRDLTEIQSQDESWFLCFVEARCCRSLANFFSASAGVKVGENADQGKTLAHWQAEGDRLEALARQLLEKRRYETVAVGIRS